MPLELFGKENKQGIPTFMLPETVLQVMRPSFGSRFLATFPFTIGRGPQDYLQFPDLRISHQCAAILYDDKF
jgi:hypothetical protein